MSDDQLVSLMREVHVLANSRECFRQVGYATLYAIVVRIRRFNQAELLKEMGSTEVPPHADSWLLWLRLARKGVAVDLPPWGSDPVGRLSLKMMSAHLARTVFYLPSIHPIWGELARCDAAGLLRQAAALPGLFELAAAAVLQMSGRSQFIEILSENRGMVAARKGKPAAALEKVILTRAMGLGADLEVAREVLLVISGRAVEPLVAALPDAVLADLANGPLKDCVDAQLQFLWALRGRPNLRGVIPGVFGRVVSLVESDEQRALLHKFVQGAVQTILPDGSHFLNALDPALPLVVPALLARSQESVLLAAQTLLAAVEALHRVLGVNCEMPTCAGWDALPGVIEHLRTRGCKICIKTMRCIAFDVLCVDPALFPAVVDFDIALRCVAQPALARTAIGWIVQRAAECPRRVAEDIGNMAMNCSSDEAAEVLPVILGVLRADARKFLTNLAKKLITRLDAEHRLALIHAVMTDEIGPRAASSVTLVPLFFGTCWEQVLAAVQALVASGQCSAAALRTCREWVTGALEGHNLPSAECGHIIENLCLLSGDSKPATRRRDEAIAVWAAGVARKHKATFSPAFLSRLESLTASRSQRLQAALQTLLRVGGVEHPEALPVTNQTVNEPL